MSERNKKSRKFLRRGLAVLLGLGFIITGLMSGLFETRAASWVLKTIPNTPGNKYPDHWGENGYSLVTHNGKSYLYIYGQHYRGDSSAKPSVFELQRWKWNDDAGQFYYYDTLTATYYNNNPKRFFVFSSLNEWENGVYDFIHKATISGATHQGHVHQPVTYSNWLTIGNGENAKIALLYYDSIHDEDKIRIRDAKARNKIQSISVDTANGIVMDIRGAMVSTDDGYDVRKFEGGRLVKHADGEYHVVGDDDTDKTGSEISVKDPSGKVIYTTAGGDEYSLGSKAQPYRYGKKNMTIPVSTLKSMTTNGVYTIEYEINVDSGRYGTRSYASTNLNAPSSGYSKTIKLLANDGAYHNYKVYESGGNLKIKVTDATPPTASTQQTPTSWTNGGVTLRIYNISDDGGSGYDYTLLPDGTKSTKTDVSYTVNANGSYSFTIYDKQGNSTTKTFTVSNIDKTSPTISFSSNGDSTWKQSNSTKVTVTDNQSGVSSMQYSWSTSNTTAPTSGWTDFSSGDTISTPSSTGTHYLWVKATDNVGNSTTVHSNGFNVDLMAPSVSADKTSGNWQDTPHQVTLTFSDSQSGVNTKQYQWSTSTSTPTNGWNNYTGTVTQPGEGTYYLHYKVTDNAGNTTTGYFGPYQYENTDPTASISYSPTGWTNGNVTITLSNIADSGGSGYDYTKKPDGTTTTSTSFTYTVSQNGTYSFIIYDKAGNSTVKTVTISNIDKSAPTFGTSYSPTGWTNGDVTIALTNINDTGGSGYDKTRLPDGTFTTSTNVSYTVSDNGSYDFTVYDKTGNSTTKTVTITNIDKVKPTATVSYSTTTATNGNVVVTVKATDDRSGVKSILLPDGTLVQGDQASYTVSQNGTYDFVVTDVAGNQTTVKAVVNNIDKTPPTLTLTASPTEWTNKPITITATASDAGGIDRIVLPDGTAVRNTTASITVTQNGTYTFQAYDKVGNITVKSITISNYDGDQPAVDIKETGRTSSKIDVQLEYGD